MTSKPVTSSVFIASGGLAGAGFSATVGGMGLVGSFGGVGLGMAPVTAAGVVVGSAAYGAFSAIADGDMAAFGAIGLGGICGAGVSATVGGMGFSVGGSAIGIGMGTMAFAGGIVGLGIYGLYKALTPEVGQRLAGAVEAFDRAQSQILEREAYIQALLELDPTLQEWDLESKFSQLDVEDELAALKAKIFGSNCSKFATPKLNATPDIPNSPPREETSLVVRDDIDLDWQCVQILPGHTASINQLAMSADGQLLASASNDRTIRLWNANDGKPIFTFFGTTEINTVVIDADRNLLFGGDFDGTITSWNLDSKTLSQTLSNRSFSGIHGGVVFAVDLSPTQRTIVSGSSDGSIKIWNRILGELKQILNGHTEAVRSLKISKNGKLLVSGSVDQTLRIWSLESYQPLQTCTGHSGCVTSVDISPDGQTIASGSTDCTAKLWDLKTGQLRNTLTGHSSAVLSVSMSPNGTTIATASLNAVKIWDLKTGECIQDIVGNYPVFFSPDGYTLVTGYRQNSLKIWKQSVRREMGDRSLLSGEW